MLIFNLFKEVQEQVSLNEAISDFTQRVQISKKNGPHYNNAINLSANIEETQECIHIVFLTLLFVSRKEEIYASIYSWSQKCNHPKTYSVYLPFIFSSKRWNMWPIHLNSD